MSKNYRPNSKKTIQWFHHWSCISFGYLRSEMDWGKGHVTVFKSYHFMFWHLRISQAFINWEHTNFSTP